MIFQDEFEGLSKYFYFQVVGVSFKPSSMGPFFNTTNRAYIYSECIVLFFFKKYEQLIFIFRMVNIAVFNSSGIAPKGKYKYLQMVSRNVLESSLEYKVIFKI